MSKKVAIVLSIVLFIVLCALIVCERLWPTAGSELIMMGLPMR